MKGLQWVILSVFTLILIILFLFDPMEQPLMPKCIFRLLTGWSCPGCGLQRALHALLHGDMVGALHYNYFLFFSGPYALVLILERWVLPKCMLQDRLRAVAEHRFLVWFYIITFFIWFVLRNVWGI